MDKQAREAKEMAKNLPLGKKIMHFWRYNWGWIVSVCAVLWLVTMVIYTTVTEPTYDITVSYYGEMEYTEEEKAQLEALLLPMISDIDGDGETDVMINFNRVLVDEADNDALYMIQNQLMAEVASRDCELFLLDERFAQLIQKGVYSGSMEVLRDVADSKLSEIFAVPEGKQLYLGVRSLYEENKESEKEIAQYELTQKIEYELLGERTQPYFPPLIVE